VRRLYLQIYAAFVLLAIVVTVTGGLLAWHARRDAARVPPFFANAIQLVARRLPAANAPKADLQSSLDKLARRLRVDASIWSASGQRLASSGEPLSPPHLGTKRVEWTRRRGGPPGVTIRLKDGRWLGLSLKRQRQRPRWLAGFAVLAGIMALGAYPVSRRITRRLERLKTGVEHFGTGELSSRVAVEGRDEVAEVARSFNTAAERIEALVAAQKRLLASASHELRSPLARLRVAVELMGAEPRPDLAEEATTDIAELDELIEDLLLAGRLDALDGLPATEPVDLLALLAEEGARVGASVSGDPVTIDGDPRLLKRMIRNLLENARRYGGDTEIEASVRRAPAAGDAARTPASAIATGSHADGDVAVITVADRGPGVAESERARIFEPFYRPEGHAEGRGGGFGLGLALVRDIARRHGGDARCLPRDGGGTVFEVEVRAERASRSPNA
jgi:signal transduction histidine kinase